jgi:hypothetical protein
MDDCPICKETLSETNVCKTKCGHTYCLGCMINHTKRNNRCPLCREEIYENISEEESDESETESESETYETRLHNYEIHGKFNNYEIHGKIKMNNNLQTILITTYVLFHYAVVNICVELIMYKKGK